jgi:hypothetical protein
MTINAGFGAYGEFAYGETADDVGSTAVAVADSLLTLFGAETATLLSLLDRPDTAAVLFGAAAVSIASSLDRGDSLAVILADALAIVSSLATGDTTLLAIADASTASTLITALDAPTVATPDAVTDVAVTLALVDAIRVKVQRLARDQMFGAYGEFAYGEHYYDLNTSSPLIREIVELFVQVSTSDAALPKLVDVATLLSALDRADAVAPMIAESPGRAELRLSRRVLNVIHH